MLAPQKSMIPSTRGAISSRLTELKNTTATFPEESSQLSICINLRFIMFLPFHCNILFIIFLFCWHYMIFTHPSQEFLSIEIDGFPFGLKMWNLHIHSEFIYLGL